MHLRAPFPRSSHRMAVAALGVTLLFATAACGGDSTAATDQVASLGSTATPSTDEADAASTEDTQTALLAFAACMRENGIDMDDPTFDADGNPQGGLFGGRDSGLDPRSDEFQAAMDTCGDLIEGITLGGPGGRGGIDPQEVQLAMNDFTACLRDQGLDVDDINFADGAPGGGGGPGAGGFGGPPANGSIPANGTPADGSAPAGGFQGPPPNGQGPGSDGFDPTARIIERLDLDPDDPAVTAAVDACQSILESAFQAPTTTTAG